MMTGLLNHIESARRLADMLGEAAVSSTLTEAIEQVKKRMKRKTKTVPAKRPKPAK